MLPAPEISPALVIFPELLFNPPVMEAPPPETVKPLAEAIDPVPVVEILPAVESTPNSVIVSFVIPPDRTSKAVPVVPDAVSLIIKAGAVPALVNAKEVAVPLLLDSSYKVTAKFLPVVVVIAFPESYACCKVTQLTFALQAAI